MPSLRTILLLLLPALFAILWQKWLSEELLQVVSIGRTMQSIDEFPFTCRKLHHEQLEGCEDMWLDERERVLYLACAGSRGRMGWNPV